MNWPVALVNTMQSKRDRATQGPDNRKFDVLFIQLKSHQRGNGRHLYPYSFLQAILCVLQFSFFHLTAAKERFYKGFIEGDGQP
jgi:hypothetical protein